MDTELEQEYDRTTALIRASEEWSDDYKQAPESFAKLLKAEARMQRKFTVYLKELADRSDTFINWGGYLQKIDQLKNIQANARIKAADEFTVDVLIQDDAVDHEDDIVLTFMYDQIETVVVIGAGAAETIYSRDVGTAALTKIVKETARKQTAELVGKKVDSDGTIIDNPKAEYQISETTRTQIRESIRTSISLGEDKAGAVGRLTKTLKDPRRAELVAQTESVNGYQGGMLNYALAAGADGKQSQYLGPAHGKRPDICGVNADAGVIGINDEYPSGHQHPAFHPRCRCGEKFHFPDGV